MTRSRTGFHAVVGVVDPDRRCRSCAPTLTRCGSATRCVLLLGYQVRQGQEQHHIRWLQRFHLNGPANDVVRPPGQVDPTPRALSCADRAMR